MPAPTARQLLKAVERSVEASEISAVAGLDPQTRAAVVEALRGVPRTARVDVKRLIDIKRRESAERAAAEAAEREQTAELDALRYRASIMPMSELVALRDDLRARIRRGEGGGVFHLGRPQEFGSMPITAGASDHGPSRLPRVARVRSRRALMEASEDVAAVPAPQALNKRSQQAAGPKLGPQSAPARPMGAPFGSDYGRWRSPGRPPWLLDEELESAKYQ